MEIKGIAWKLRIQRTHILDKYTRLTSSLYFILSIYKAISIALINYMFVFI